MKAAMQKVLVLGVISALPFALSGCMTAMVSAASGTAGAVVGSDSRNIDTMFYDETIEQQGNDVLYSNPLLSNSEDFKVSIYSMSGNVLLTGQTTNTDYLNWCVEQIRKQNYVREVYNYVTYQKPVSTSVQASDAYITSKVRSKLLFGKSINSGRFKIVTENSQVFLMGFVNPDEAKRAVNAARETDGVTKVYTIFDYMTNEAVLKERAQADDSIVVKRVDNTTGQVPSGTAAGSSSYPVYSTPSSGSSTYITPVDNSANGGAAIVDDGSNSLLAPAQPLEIY